MIKQLAKYIGKYKYLAIATPILVIVDTIAELILPSLMAKIVDVGVANGDIGYIIRIGIVMICIALGVVVVGVLSTVCSSKAGNGYGYNLRNAMYDKLLSFSFADIDRFSTASLITRLTNDVRTIQMAFTMGLRMLVRAPGMLIIALFLAVRINARLALIYLVAIPVLAVAVFGIMFSAHHLFFIMQQKLDQLNATVQENLIAIRVVKAFVREDYEFSKFKHANNELRRASMNAILRVMLNNPLTSLIVNFTLLAVYWFGGRMVGYGQMLSGDLLAFVQYLQQVMMGLMMFSQVLLQATRAKACATRVLEVINHEPDIVDVPEVLEEARALRESGELPKLSGAVEFRDVHFKYVLTGTGEDVLRGVSFTAEPGQTIAIVGGTGTGKSSLVNLIPRFYDVTEGSVLIDGRDVREYDIEHLRSNVGMVLQTNVLFTGTIRENMRWGDVDATDDEIWAALKQAQAYEFVSALPEGLDTVLKQGGVNVSGGQKQRLCIARAMLKKPAILILDDSTSAVDSDTEAKIRETFENELSYCTVFIIAQRISSVRSADKIIVLDDGLVKGVGTHEELLGSNEIYQEIYNSQQEGVFGGE